MIEVLWLFSIKMAQKTLILNTVFFQKILSNAIREIKKKKINLFVNVLMCWDKGEIDV